MKKFCLFLLAVLFSAVSSLAQNGVKAYEGILELPTYLLDKAESAPIFDRDWSYQRARRSVYPYVLDDNMTRNKEVRPYKAVYLENEYVEACILPEIGGRLFYAIDKTNGYDLFYHQHVVKPANVGMLGAWISGGVEWNAIHHHRASTNMHVDYKIEEKADGSKTVWVGELELRHRMTWAVGVTLHPGKSYLEISGKVNNGTANSNSMLFWSNVATKVDDTYEIIFSPKTDFVTFHCKNWFAHWPITHETFNDLDYYQNDLDARFFRNHFSGNSMFIYDQKDDFIAGYDHGQDAGTVLTANHHINKGGKFWLWGPNSMWDTKILTDTDGHYIELMMGAYSDNQPDYSWINPYEIKNFTQYYYGIRNIGGVKAGNKEASLNFEPAEKEGQYFIGLNVTSPQKNMRIEVLHEGQAVYSAVKDLAPDLPFTEHIALDKAAHTYTVVVKNGQGAQILSYTPRADSGYDLPLPEIVRPPLRPHEIQNNEECYLVGLRNMQFYNPFIDPADYFNEVLRRDPSDTRSNTMMGVLARRNAQNEKAANYFRAAIQRQTHDYTRPADCQALYNLGVILKEQGKITEALDTLYRASWNYTYNSPANFQLSQIYLALGDHHSALERLEEAITYNGNNLNALNLKASILRLEGKKEEALKVVETVLGKNPLNAYALYEKDLLTGGQEHITLMRDVEEQYIELALAYYANGLKDQTQEIFTYIDGRKAYPTIKMWLGYMAHAQGDKQSAKKYYEAALALDVAYCNPFRPETIAVLQLAKTYCPDSWKPYYFLGNLLYDKQKEEALAQWEKVVEMNPAMAMAWRNMGWYHWLESQDYAQSAVYYAKAVALDPANALFLEEQDQVLEAGKVAVQKRFDILKAHHTTAVKRYYPLAMEVVTGTFVGEYDYVLSLLKDCYFPTREGVANFHDVYVDALLMAGLQKVSEGKTEEAVALYQKGFEYPENHQVFLVDTRTPRDAQIYVFIAEAYKTAGKHAKANQYYKKAAGVGVKETNYRYWQAKALLALGDKTSAYTLLQAMVEEGKAAEVEDIVNFYGAEGTTGASVDGLNANAYYTQALGHLGLGNTQQAQSLFKKASALIPSNLWFNYFAKL